MKYPSLPDYPSTINSQQAKRNIQIFERPKDYRSVLIVESSQESVNNRNVIDDSCYSSKVSVFNRLGSIKPVSSENVLENYKRRNIEPYKPSKRLSVDTSGSLSLSSTNQSKSSIKIMYTPLSEESLREVTNNQTGRTTKQLSNTTNKSEVGTVDSTYDGTSFTRRQTTEKPSPIPKVAKAQPLLFSVRIATRLHKKSRLRNLVLMTNHTICHSGKSLYRNN